MFLLFILYTFITANQFEISEQCRNCVIYSKSLMREFPFEAPEELLEKKDEIESLLSEGMRCREVCVKLEQCEEDEFPPCRMCRFVGFVEDLLNSEQEMTKDEMKDKALLNCHEIQREMRQKFSEENSPERRGPRGRHGRHGRHHHFLERCSRLVEDEFDTIYEELVNNTDPMNVCNSLCERRPRPMFHKGPRFNEDEERPRFGRKHFNFENNEERPHFRHRRPTFDEEIERPPFRHRKPHFDLEENGKRPSIRPEFLNERPPFRRRFQ